MDIKKITEGMTAPEVAQLLDDNFKGLDTEKASKKELSELSSRVDKLSADSVGLSDSDDESDMQIADEEGNILVEFKNGHIKMKNFDSSEVVINQKFKEKKWCSLGTSITWYNNNQKGFEKGYQGWLQEKMSIQLVNKGVNGGTLVGLASNLNIIEQGCDIYTIEHGVNDWGNSIPVGSIDDYINNTGADTFFGAYRKVIDRIYEMNQNAIIILCTPRKSRGFKGFLPESCHGEKSGNTLKDYADAAVKIANRESLFLCDWFNECQVNDHNLPIYSIDDALHPNDEGYKQMAEILIKQFEKIY
jgi:lysophospholipase L1-like esterase